MLKKVKKIVKTQEPEPQPIKKVKKKKKVIKEKVKTTVKRDIYSNVGEYEGYIITMEDSKKYINTDGNSSMDHLAQSKKWKHPIRLISEKDLPEWDVVIGSGVGVIATINETKSFRGRLDPKIKWGIHIKSKEHILICRGGQ